MTALNQHRAISHTDLQASSCSIRRLVSRPVTFPQRLAFVREPRGQNASGLSLTHPDPFHIRAALSNGTPAAILDALGQLPTPSGGTLADDYAYQPPVSERWYPGPLFEHHRRVIEALHAYFDLPPGMDAQLLDLTAAFHDPGKSNSIPRLEAGALRDAQKTYTLKMIDWWKPSLPLDGSAFNRMRAVITTNAHGSLFQGKLSVEAAANEIREGAQLAAMDPVAFLKLMTVFTQADIAAYTMPAGGPKHLDHVFELTADGQFVPDEARGRLKYNPANEKLVALLEASVRNFGKRKSP